MVAKPSPRDYQTPALEPMLRMAEQLEREQHARVLAIRAEIRRRKFETRRHLGG